MAAATFCSVYLDTADITAQKPLIMGKSKVPQHYTPLATTRTAAKHDDDGDGDDDDDGDVVVLSKMFHAKI